MFQAPLSTSRPRNMLDFLLCFCRLQVILEYKKIYKYSQIYCASRSQKLTCHIHILHYCHSQLYTTSTAFYCHLVENAKYDRTSLKKMEIKQINCLQITYVILFCLIPQLVIQKYLSIMHLKDRHILELLNILLYLHQIAFLKYLLKWDCLRKRTNIQLGNPIYFCQIIKTFEKENGKLLFLCNNQYKK